MALSLPPICFGLNFDVNKEGNSEPMTPSKKRKTTSSAAKPRLSPASPAEFQSFGSIVRMPNGLSEQACQTSVKALNQILADTITLRDLYKKHHWQVSGHTFIQLHELYDKHFEVQAELVDSLAERIQLLGGVSVAMAHDVAELAQIARPPIGREPAPNQISRLLKAHEILLNTCHKAMSESDKQGDDGTSDLLVDVIRANEFQVWFLAQHLVPTPVTAGEGVQSESSVQ